METSLLGKVFGIGTIVFLIGSYLRYLTTETPPTQTYISWVTGGNTADKHVAELSVDELVAERKRLRDVLGKSISPPEPWVDRLTEVEKELDSRSSP